MIVTTRFSLDAADTVQTAIIAGMTSGDSGRVVCIVRDFDPLDDIVQAVFTAKISLADSDTNPNTIQRVLPSPDGTITDLFGDGTTYRFIFELEPDDTTRLVTQRFYDIRLWVIRGGQEFPRTVQRGTIRATQGVTSLDSMPSFAASVAATQTAGALVGVAS